MKLRDIKFRDLEIIAGFTVLAAEIVIGVPLLVYHIGSEAYRNIRQQAPQVNQQLNEFVTSIRSNFPTHSNSSYSPEDTEGSEDADKKYNPI
jgi:hypothetical protein